ncbi:MAG: phosphatidylserine decarboxylase family protein [Rikenellaceae bacterium]
MTIDKEGYGIIRNALLIFVVLTVASYLFLPLWATITIGSICFLLFAFILRFFRLPYRTTLIDDDNVYSPADGTVVVSERVYEDEYLKTECIQVSVFMSIWNVHANWFPVAGKVEYFRHHNGEFMVAWHPKSSTENERTSTVVVMENGEKIMFRQIAGLLAKRIVSYAVEGESFAQNSRCGFIKFGSRVDVFLPLNAKVKVKLGDKMVGSQSVIATFKNKK